MCYTVLLEPCRSYSQPMSSSLLTRQKHSCWLWRDNLVRCASPDVEVAPAWLSVLLYRRREDVVRGSDRTNEISFVGAGRAIHGDHSDKKSSMGVSHVNTSSWGNDELNVDDHRSCGMPIFPADLTETPPPTLVYANPRKRNDAA